MRWLILLALLPSLAFAQVAASPHTQDVVIYDPTTNVVRAIIIPDSDKQLDDPAFNPKDCGPKADQPCVQLRLPKTVETGASDVTAAMVAGASVFGGVSLTLQPPLVSTVSNAAEPSSVTAP